MEGEPKVMHFVDGKPASEKEVLARVQSAQTTLPSPRQRLMDIEKKLGIHHFITADGTKHVHDADGNLVPEKPAA